jgi:Cu+-exporting ATPase
MPDKRTSVTDPVCGMTISPDGAAGQSDYNGQTFYFCSTGCKTKFDGSPEQYPAAAGPSGRR